MVLMSDRPPYPWIEFELSIGTWDLLDEAYPDTGFEGGLIIPIGVGRELLARPAKVPMRLADGEIVEVACWSGALAIEAHRFPVQVAAMGARYLLGREVLDQMEVCFEFGRRLRLRFSGEARGQTK
jgi:predicted aspartyl protease